MKTRSALPLVALGLLGLAACGGSDSSNNTVPADADVVVRAVDGIAWNAKEYSVTAEDGEVTVYAVNDSSIPHNLHVQTTDGVDIGNPIDLPSRRSDGTATYKLEPGQYVIQCKISGHESMRSDLIVD